VTVAAQLTLPCRQAASQTGRKTYVTDSCVARVLVQQFDRIFSQKSTINKQCTIVYNLLTPPPKLLKKARIYPIYACG
jgi:hypothetical protein